jgi:hypothetical protein
MEGFIYPSLADVKCYRQSLHSRAGSPVRLLPFSDDTKHSLCVQSFRQVPTFGQDTIRRFSNNVSELKRLAARDFEDLLQVCV